MLKIHLKLMSFAMVLIGISGKIIASDTEEKENQESSIVVYKLDLRRSAHYTSVLYNCNQKETEDEHYQYVQSVNNNCCAQKNKQKNKALIDKVEQNIFFINLPDVASVNSLDSVDGYNADIDGCSDEQGSHDSDVTDKWSMKVESIFSDDPERVSSDSISSLRQSLHGINIQNDSNINSPKIDNSPQDAQFGIFSFPDLVQSYLSPEMNHYPMPKNPNNTPEKTDDQGDNK